jgi:DME family drug/metabolite transporter
MYVYFIGIIIALLWGVRPILQKQIVYNTSPETIMVITGALYFIFIAIYFIIYKNKVTNEIYQLDKEQTKILIFIALVSFFTSLLYYYALTQESASKVVTITSIWPIFALIFATLFLNEKFNPKLVISIIVIILLLQFVKDD